MEPKITDHGNQPGDQTPRWVEKASKGDREAQACLYRQYSQAMFNLCIRMTGRRDTAEDVLQDAFIIAFDKLGQLRAKDHFGGWLRKIVIHACIRFCKQTLVLPGSDEDLHAVQKEPGTEEVEEPSWWMNIDTALVHREIKSLPDGCRAVFILFALEDYGHKEIAGMLDITESTSKTQYRRAKQLLKERITRICQHDGQI